MNRVINQADQVVEDMLKGWLLAHGERVRVSPDNPRVIQRVGAPEHGKVGIVTGGGSGHEPAFLGYVGNGLVDAVAVGEIFSSPTARSFHDAIRGADGGAGVACLYGNYAGDNMNVAMAMQMAQQDGILVRTVVANDDVASAPKGDEGKRRGVAGEILMWKVGAAAAQRGADLETVIALAQRAIDNTRSIGVGLSACVIPAVGKANFAIEYGHMEVGIGHHGEPGVDVRPTVSAAEMSELMLAAILPDLPYQSGDRVAVLVSGLGATPLMEQYILYGELARRLQEQGITIAFNRVGNLFSSLEMMGVTLTVMKLDDELETCLTHPCESVGLTQHGVSDSMAPGKSGMAAKPAGPAVTGSATTQRSKAASASNQASAGQTTPQDSPTPRQITGAAVTLAAAGDVVRDLIVCIVANREYLSEIDGQIGDGDHGINMAKGFLGCGARLDGLGARAQQLPLALEQLSQALMDDIGGSMGPLYGRFFDGLSATLAPHAEVDASLFGEALDKALSNVQMLGNAQVGDKTLIDTLEPARSAFHTGRLSGSDFRECLQCMADAAAQGRDSTRDLQARIGRSARLGPRSIGVLDAGATSCCLILQSLAHSLQRHLDGAARA